MGNKNKQKSKKSKKKQVLKKVGKLRSSNINTIILCGITIIGAATAIFLAY